jgi:hypothetical protein
LIINLPLPNNRSPAKLLAAVRGALDFLFLAQYPLHTTETLDLLDDALRTFHLNKDIFIDLGIRAHFNIPKFHNIHHYQFYIETYGTTDNFNTEYTERLHIDFAKDAYRATNFKDVYPQMSRWLERQEKIKHHSNFIQWRLSEATYNEVQQHNPVPRIVLPRMLKMTRHPSAKAVRFTTLMNDYGASFFPDALARYLVSLAHPTLSQRQIEQCALHFALPFQKVPVFHRIKFTSVDMYATQQRQVPTVVDSIHVQPATKNKQGKDVPARFDIALINDGTGGHTGLKGMTIYSKMV